MSVILNKLVAVFGVNAKLSAVYSKEAVTFSGGGVTISFPVGKDGIEAKVPGQYDAVLKEKEVPQGDVADTAERQVEYELVETLVQAEPAISSSVSTPKAKPAAKQSPAFGWGAKERF